MPEPISLDVASLAALRDLIKDEVAATVRSPAPKARERAPPSEREGDLLEIISKTLFEICVRSSRRPDHPSRWGLAV